MAKNALFLCCMCLGILECFLEEALVHLFCHDSSHGRAGALGRGTPLARPRSRRARRLDHARGTTLAAPDVDEKLGWIELRRNQHGWLASVRSIEQALDTRLLRVCLQHIRMAYNSGRDVRCGAI